MDKVFEELKAIGVSSIYASFSGSGDSGYIDPPDFEPKNITVPSDLIDGLLDYMYDFLYTRHCGWEINEGSHGEFFFSLGGDPNMKCICNLANIEYDTEQTVVEL